MMTVPWTVTGCDCFCITFRCIVMCHTVFIFYLLMITVFYITLEGVTFWSAEIFIVSLFVEATLNQPCESIS